MLELVVLRDSNFDGLPSDEDFQKWASAAIETSGPVAAGLVLKIVDEATSRQLNHRYRGKDKPTNVLSFPAELPEAVRKAIAHPPLGDLVICAPVVHDEARSQDKAQSHHWAHLTVHGVLHLRGYDHVERSDASCMEALEIKVLAGLGFANPYETHNGLHDR